MVNPSLTAFGSLAPWPSPAEFDNLRASLVQHEELKPLREAYSQLPQLWKILCDECNTLESVDGISAAEQLTQWLLTGQTPTRSFARNNILSLPLTITSHICEYISYHKNIGSTNYQPTAVQGFCAGQLSAGAIDNATSLEDVGQRAVSSMYMAFAVGSQVDKDALENGQTNCLAIRCKAPNTLETVRTWLGAYDEAYISVIRSSSEATLTVPSFCSAQLSRQLSSEGVSVVDTGLTGRYHSASHHKACDRILSVVQDFEQSQDSKLKQAVYDILTKVSDWPSQLDSTSLDQDSAVLIIGDAIRSSIPRNVQIIGTESMKLKPSTDDSLTDYPANAIAVVGMSCKLPGADSVEEFWQLLTKGTAMAEQVPEGRWPNSVTSRGTTSKKKFWGNFLKDIDAFDHRFFKKSAREAASMDPQQRLLLQAAYEALESSGYFSSKANSASYSEQARNIGCYIGLCAVDYDMNTTCHAPNAFSTLGTLRAFLSGKLSHYFGWSGPSLTFDTACSSSAVAIHTACRALQANECTQALAGGVALFTSPYLYENLAAAHFLSPTGATKPFDSKADGYCRGEGLGLVMLKKLSAAVADGDEVLAVIGGSAINQNDSCVPITVPNAPSQQTLYQNAAKQAGIQPQQVSFVEAHGTGTPVGDPIEMDSIRNVFGGPHRRSKLIVSSVKGNIGHLEGASGVAALIKAILQIQHRTAVTQASFQSLNPKIPPLEPDNVIIPTKNTPLTDRFITACVNNYGAAGSNSTLMIMQPPTITSRQSTPISKYPIAIAANSEASVQEYCRALQDYTIRNPDKTQQIGSVAYNLNKRHNHKLPYILTAAASGSRPLQVQLTQPVTQRQTGLPLVLAFGGQVRDYVGLSKEIFEQFAILRSHLDRCDDILRGMGHPSLYPSIFQCDPIENLVVLHTAVFALQYASAKAWIDCGLTVNAVIGHSLGQLTALTVSGTLSLQDGLKFVAGRASLMKKYWGAEPGSMILVDTDANTISSLPHSLEVACYNGPTSHVLAGEQAAVEAFETTLSQNNIRFKRLQVTNGFHSKFTEPLIAPLAKLASTIRFNKPTIPIETCSQGSTWQQATPELLARHTREPVFFSQAVKRIAAQGDCTWLEVGSDSGIAGMVRRAIGDSQHQFLSCTLSKATSLDVLVENTMNLWKRGHGTLFWAFHPLQQGDYERLRLPPYQWDKNRHWLELLPPPTSMEPSEHIPKVEVEVPRLLTLANKDGAGGVFRIDARSEEYKNFVSGHVVAGSPLCPATVYMEIAARACKMLVSWEPAPLLGFSDLKIDSPLGMSTDRDITMTLRQEGSNSWEFNVKSAKSSEKSISHVNGLIQLQSNANVVQREFSRYERLIGQSMAQALFDDHESECVRGPMLYKLFSRVVQYSGAYQGLKSVAAKDGRIAGIVTSNPQECDDTVLTQPPTIDSWMQIAGFHANSFHPCPDDDVFVFTTVDYMQFGPEYKNPSAGTWKIFSNLTPIESNEVSNDIFVFDATSGKLVVLILGARFNKVRLGSLNKVLARLNGASANMNTPVTHKLEVPRPVTKTTQPQTLQAFTESVAPMVADARESIFEGVCSVFELVAEVPRQEIRGNASVDDLGIDSLMMMEVVSELSSYFSVNLPIEDMECLTDVDSLVNYLSKRGCGQSSTASSTTCSSSSSVAPGTPSSMTMSTDGHSDKQVDQLFKLLQEHLELDSVPSVNDNLADLGLDSLLAIELGDDMEKMFSTTIDLHQIDETSTIKDLARLAGLEVGNPSQIDIPPVTLNDPIVPVAVPHITTEPSIPSATTRDGAQHEAFDQIRYDFDKFSTQEGFEGFWDSVYPIQERLVLSYTADAFKKLGCDLAHLSFGSKVPQLLVLEKHRHLLDRLHKILADGGYLSGDSNGYVRTAKPFDLDHPQVMLNQIISEFPLHASEHKLLDVTGSRLAECLTGKADPLALLFASRANRKLLADVYDLAPMCRATTRLLGTFLEKAFAANEQGKTYHFLEVGGGTGGTTKFVVDYLTRKGISFTYTFTDISSALVGGMKKIMAEYDCMRYATLDVEKPSSEFAGQYDALISTNCVHATGNATSALANLRTLLRPDGVMALVEFTTGLYWFDLVYGLLDGWWLFSDGRKHALADIPFWEKSMLDAGYQHVNWTDGQTKEARTLRLICGFNSPVCATDQNLRKRAGVAYETVPWKEVDGLELNADIYYPSSVDNSTKRPVAIMFHGGGHVLFTRKDIHIKHVKILLERGFLPISFDYRLCPEVNLAEGPMTDACDALQWVREQLAEIKLSRKDVQVDVSRVVAAGWSAGGQLAMTLGYTAPQRGLKAPDAVLAFYCPTNFEAEWWTKPILPQGIKESPGTEYDLLEGIKEKPLVGYKPMTLPGAPMTLQDPRWRIVIHYNWKAQLVPVLVNGLPSKMEGNSKDWESLPMPSRERIQAVSPYAQIVQGTYRTPTFIIHGQHDDLIPWEQSRDTIGELKKQGVRAGIAVPKAGHAFDLWGETDWSAVMEGYDFLQTFI